jgi:hypothetical protein
MNCTNSFFSLKGSSFTMTNTSSNNSSLDERALASAALDASEELLQSLTAQNAGVFVQTEHRSRDFRMALLELERAIETGCTQTEKTLHIVSLYQHPSSTSEEKGSTTTGPNEDRSRVSLAELSERHRLRRRTLLQHGSLLELLELPSLMDACIRSQDNHLTLYEDALSIANFANTLARRHHHHHSSSTSTTHNTNTIVDNVIHQIRARQMDLRRHLLERLKGPVSMPECLEVVTAVRRLNAIQLEQQQLEEDTTTKDPSHSGSVWLEITHERMEYQLQIDFLEHRDVWCFGRGTAGSDATLMDRLERYRTRLFEVSTQFQAIFRRSNTLNKNTTNNNTSNPEDKMTATTTPPPQQVLNLWLARRIETVLEILRQEIQAVVSTNNSNDAAAAASSSTTTTLLDAGYVRDVLEASLFFGTSMGRLGANFTATLSPIFGSAMIHIVMQQHWNVGVTKFIETITVCRDAGVASPLVSSNSSSATTDGTTSLDATSSVTLSEDVDPDGQPQPPPKQLLEFPPLARLVNAFLQGLNELRRCLLPDIFPALRRHCQIHVLDRVEMELRGLERAVNIPVYSGEATAMRTIATQMNSILTQLVRPYLLGSLEAAFGNTQMARTQYQIVHAYCHPPPKIDDPQNRDSPGHEDAVKGRENQPKVMDTPSTDKMENVVADDDDDDDEESTGQHESEEGEDDPPVANSVTSPVDNPVMVEEDEALANELLQDD